MKLDQTVITAHSLGIWVASRARRPGDAALTAPRNSRLTGTRPEDVRAAVAIAREVEMTVVGRHPDTVLIGERVLGQLERRGLFLRGLMGAEDLHKS